MSENENIKLVKNSRKRRAPIPVKDLPNKRKVLTDITNVASKINSPKKLKFNDIDVANKSNIYETPEYAFDIFEYMRSREQHFVIQSDFLSFNDVTPKMRAILVDWMVEIQEKFQLNHETLYLAVKLVDLYLHQVDISREKLQLLGATCLIIAAKFDESNIPCVDDYLFICDDAYKRSELLSIERSIFDQVGFDINVPISYRFLRRFAKCTKCGMKTLTLARYILESSLLSYQFVDRSASKMAAAVLWLALKMTNKQQWDDTLVYYTSYTEKDIIQLASELNSMIRNIDTTSFNTIFIKYSSPIFYQVASHQTISQEEIYSYQQLSHKTTKFYFEV